MRNRGLIQKGIFFFILLVLVLIPAGGRSAPDAGNAQYPNWLASDAAVDCDGPSDGTYEWYETEFDDSSWQLVTPPMTNDIPPGQDRFYRTEFTKPASGSVYLNIAADDGIWVYINGDLVSGTGEVACHEGGCTGDIPWWCWPQEAWEPLDITSDLDPGTNTIAVHVSNLDKAGSASYFWLSLDVEDLRFNLPIDYSQRASKARPTYFYELQKQLLSVFDHSTAGDDQLQSFLGPAFDNADGQSDCQVGLNCYDGSLSYEFGTDDQNATGVYAVAAGTIVSGKSGCLTGDDYGCRVCVSHGITGYSTLYTNLQSGSILTSGTVTEATKIGDMDTGDGPVIYEMGFLTFYDASQSCLTGKEVDPSGWADAVTTDPRETATGNKSLSMWFYPFLSSTIYDPGVANSLAWQERKFDYDNTRVNFPTNAYTDTLRATTSLAPGPSHPYPLAGTGNTFYLNAIDESGDVVDEVNNDFEIWINYSDTLPDDVWENTLALYQFDTTSDEWLQLTTTISGTEYSADTSAIAPFALLGERKYLVDTNTVGDGSISIDPPEPYHYNDVVTVTAQADPKWAFSGWTGDVSVSTSPVTVTIDSSKEITGTFTQVLFDVDVTIVGSGSVDSDPPGQVEYRDVVTLTATPASGWYFSEWSGDHTGNENPAVITVESDQDITAAFEQYGSITIKKESDPQGGTGFSFAGDLGTFNLDDNGSRTFTNLEAGDYDVTEILPANWQMDGNPVCTGGDSTNIINGIQINLDPGEAVTCTFNNQKRGSITISNFTHPDWGTWFSYTGDLGNFSLKNGLDQYLGNQELKTYVIHQTEIVGWELAGVSCSGGDATEISNGVSIDLGPGEEISCTFENNLANGIYLPLMIRDN